MNEYVFTLQQRYTLAVRNASVTASTLLEAEDKIAELYPDHDKMSVTKSYV